MQLAFIGFRLPSLLSVIILSSVIFSDCALAGELRIAVAANFAVTMKDIAKRFESDSGIKVVISPGSTGKLFAQIVNGAPFDVFFSADNVSPLKLLEKGKGISRQPVYLCSGSARIVERQKGVVVNFESSMIPEQIRFLAIANPKLAPYGKAAMQVLQHKRLWDNLKGRIVTGENIAQAFKYVQSGNADLGFVAYSQIISLRENLPGEYWLIDQKLYDPIEQQAIALTESEDVRRFLEFVKSSEVREIILRSGYDISH